MASVDVTTKGRSAAEILAWSRTMFGPALHEAIDSLPPAMRHIGGYHLGWWDANGVPETANGGKAIRPALALLSAQAVGGTATNAVPAAVAVELVHNFSLLHDDVIDGDETRRHRLTAWRVFGVGNAILAGDAFLMLSTDVLAGAAVPDRPTAGSADAGSWIQMLNATVQALIEGQYADISFESRSDVDLPECLQMAERKTAALLRCACALGGAAGGGTPQQIEHLTNFGEHIGLAFQVADDMQGIWGDPQVTGKPVHSDLRNRKKSLPVVAAQVSGTAAGDELAAWMGREGVPSDAEMARAADLVDLAGGREWSRLQLETLRTEAGYDLQALGTTTQACEELAVLARLVTGSATSHADPRGARRGVAGDE